MSAEAKFIAFEMGVIADRMQMRVDHAAERFSETVGISTFFAAEIVRWCRRAQEEIEPAVEIPEPAPTVLVDDKEILF